MSGAREQVLARVRTALGDVPPGEPAVPPPYESPPASGLDAIARFAERIADYRAELRDAADVAKTVATVCAAHGARRLAVPAALPAAWRPPAVELLPDADLSARELDALDGALTGCALAIAETGTIVLDGGERSGRRALTLVPDLHLCVVERGQVVPSVPDAVRALEGTRGPFTLVSGPSATSDIELERVEGVHGPRRLVVLMAA